MYHMPVFFRNSSLFSFGRGSFLVRPAAGPAGGRHAKCGTSIGSGRAPWPMPYMVSVREQLLSARVPVTAGHAVLVFVSCLLRLSNRVILVPFLFFGGATRTYNRPCLELDLLIMLTRSRAARAVRSYIKTATTGV